MPASIGHFEAKPKYAYPLTVEWNVAVFMAGTGIYFALPFEPGLMPLCVITCALLVIYAAFARKNIYHGVAIMTYLLFVLLGLGRATWHSEAVSTQFLPEGYYEVTGWIEAVEKSGTGTRWRIRVRDIEGRRSNFTPERIRVKVHTQEFTGGDNITLRAILSPPSLPAIHNGYDSARRAYFDKISAHGFAVSKPAFAPYAPQNWRESLTRKFVTFRYSLVDRILDKAPEQTAGLQVALLTGVRTYIPEPHTEALRAAGLAHILAISGLHMGLLAGSVYGVMTFLLALIVPLSRAYDVRKFAAVVGAVAAAAYLLLSGASVATQRAFIMALIIFAAIILNRRAISIRSVAVAACITLWLHPESLVSAGFQMSFSAVLALVVVYQHWHSAPRSYQGIISRTASGVTTLSLTSLVAGTATAGFAALHFGRIARYGFFGNLLAMPIFTFIVMPAAMLSFVAMPFGLDHLPLAVMGWGLNLILLMSNWVIAFPDAMMLVKAPPSWIIGVFSIVFISLCLGNRKIRFASLAAILIIIMLWAKHPSPVIRISEDGRIAFWDEASKNVLYVDKKRGDRFGRNVFQRHAGRQGAKQVVYKTEKAQCDIEGCRVKIKGLDVAIVNHPSQIPLECETSDLVIFTKRNAGPVARRHCVSVLIDHRVLRSGSAQSIYITTDDKIRVKSANSEARKRRPWGQ
ncbi:MAG: ComEC/Rec2 family competence protein [Maricaulaceae bacterium]